MKEQLEQRLALLEQEFNTGQQQLNDLNAQRDNLEKTLLRISGAIQVLKEEIQKLEGAEQPAPAE